MVQNFCVRKSSIEGRAVADSETEGHRVDPTMRVLKHVQWAFYPYSVL